MASHGPSQSQSSSRVVVHLASSARRIGRSTTPPACIVTGQCRCRGIDTPHGKRGEATTSPQSPTGQRHAGRNWLIPRPDNSDSIGHRQIDNVGDVAHSCSR